jgi:hypothetical protein
MFHKNKYTKWYHAIVNSAKAREKENDTYYERHHVVPKSMGGSDRSHNIVRLTAKEHFVVHHLLTKMCVDSRDHSKMCNAFFAMHIHSTKNRYFTPRTYALAKFLMAESKRKLVGELNPWFGKKHTEEAKCKMKEKRVGRVCRHDTTIYLFFHIDVGEVMATQSELYIRFGLDKKGINMVVKGKIRSYKGWSFYNRKEKPSLSRKEIMEIKPERIRMGLSGELPKYIYERKTKYGQIRYRVKIDTKHQNTRATFAVGTFSTLEEAVAALNKYKGSLNQNENR